LISALAPVVFPFGPAAPDANQKTVKAAKDFEALLIGQMLKSMRGDKSSWLGSGDDADGGDPSDDTALSLGEQQMAQAIADGGGLGLSRMIAAGLRPPADPAVTQNATDVATAMPLRR
jgi:Rod binding domain-containing protein